MKEKFLQLVKKLAHIETLFHNSGSTRGTKKLEIIYDVPEFQSWLQEIQLLVQEIVDRTGDTFAEKTLNSLSAGFNGWSDKQHFSELKGKIVAMGNNVDRYYSGEANKPSTAKVPKIFISHSSKDVEYISAVVDLLNRMGLNEDHIICTSLPGYGIPIGKDILDYLREQFELYNLHVIIVHSHNYYKSVVCMNEMGAAWVLRTNCTSILLPGFDYNMMAGAVNNSSIAIKLDDNELELKDKLNQLMEIVVQEFGVRRVSSIVWEQWRDTFIKKTKTVFANMQPAEKTDSERIAELQAKCKRLQADANRYCRLFVKAYKGKHDNEVEEEYQGIEIAQMRDMEFRVENGTE